MAQEPDELHREQTVGRTDRYANEDAPESRARSDGEPGLNADEPRVAEERPRRSIRSTTRRPTTPGWTSGATSTGAE